MRSPSPSAPQTIVIKLGGEVLEDSGQREGELAALAGDIKQLAEQNIQIAVVHGGGKQATDLSKRLGIETKMVGGRRITDGATLDVMKMVVAGKLNVDLCGVLVAAGAKPVGLHGMSGPLIRAHKRPPRVVSGGGPDPIDFGHVGDIDGYDLNLLQTLWSGGYVPVIATLGGDPQTGAAYNINGDLVGSQLAMALEANKLLLVTGVPGVFADISDPASRFAKLSAETARAAIEKGAISGGMIPKIEESLEVLRGGVGEVQILGRLKPRELISAVKTPGSFGTVLTLS